MTPVLTAEETKERKPLESLSIYERSYRPNRSHADYQRGKVVDGRIILPASWRDDEEDER